MAGFAVQLSLTFSDLNGHSSFSNIRVKYNQLLEGSDQFKHTQKKTKAKNCIPRQIDKPRFSKGVENKVNIVSSPTIPWQISNLERRQIQCHKDYLNLSNLDQWEFGWP